MPQSIDDKYVKQTLDALSSSQINVGLVAVRLAELPVAEQHKFFKLAINYIQVLRAHGNRGWTKAGLEPLVKACQDLMDVVDIHFPDLDEQAASGTDYVQL